MSEAPLYSFPDAPIDGAAEWVQARDGARLRAAFFEAPGTPIGTVIVNPGRTEPIEKYAEVVEELQARGFSVLIHDWRGQGLSQRFAHVGFERDGVSKGHARGWRIFLSDLGCVLEAFAARMPPPWIALGHSMGGCLTLLAMSENKTPFQGAILTAPMLGLRLGGRPRPLVAAVAALMTFLGQAGKATPPTGAQPHRPDYLDQGVFTHDDVRWRRYMTLLDRAPELALGDPTWGWLQFALTATARLSALRKLEQVQAPVIIVTAERDRVVAVEPQRMVAERLPRGRYVQVANAFHEILIETDDRRAVFWRAFDDLVVQLRG